MNVTEKAYQVLQGVSPRDRQDCEFHMASTTAEVIKSEQRPRSGSSDPWHTMQYLEGSLLFGRPIREDNSLPLGEIVAVVETAQDRAIRRARERGVTINVMPPVQFPQIVSPPPPTLKSLLKHWRKKVLR